MFRHIRSLSRSLCTVLPKSHNLIKHPIENYTYFYNNQFKINEHDQKILKIINKNNVHTLDQFYSSVINHIDDMYQTLNTFDKTTKRTYHYDFTMDFLSQVTKTGLNTRLFFTFSKLNFEYLMHIRPTCMYCVQFLKSPFVTVEVEGKVLDCRELPFHDIGHAHVMNRQDRWLFETLYENPIDLVRSWVNTKNKYFDAINKLEPNLAHVVKLYLFDIVHDRGYQFYLPILNQQIGSKKNIENFKTKIMRGDFNDLLIPNIFNYIDNAHNFLTELTKKLLIDENDNILSLNKSNVKFKKYLLPTSHNGIPKNVHILENGDVFVNINKKLVSLFEIELLSADIYENPLLTNERISKLNKINGSLIIDNIGKIHPVGNSIRPNLKNIEIFKLERLFLCMIEDVKVNYTITKLPVICDESKVSDLSEISIEPIKHKTLKYINKNPHDRFVKTIDLCNSYVKYDKSILPNKDPFVRLVHLGEEYTLGIVNTDNNINIAKAISSILTRSVDEAKNVVKRGKYKYEGYVPKQYIECAQLEYVSPHAISNLWGKFGYRFVLSKIINYEMSEIVATALIASSKSNLFFFTHKYNNIKVLDVEQNTGYHKYSPNSKVFTNVDWNIKDDDNINKWFDRFDMPIYNVYKPDNYNQLANFCVEKEGNRGLGLGKFLIESIVKHYAIRNKGSIINHSQPLICGNGLFQLADPSWKKFMMDIGFKIRIGAESFYIERDWAKLTPITFGTELVSNIKFNEMFGLIDQYNVDKDLEKYYLLDRVEHIKKLHESNKAKLQYYQLMYPFKLEDR